MRQPASNDILSVSELNRRARSILEAGLPEVWLEAEISNLARPGSGHLYFSLKDGSAQVRCAMFRGNNRRLGFIPENGMAVLIHAKVGLYEARGEFQLVVDHMEEAGEGQLRRQFEALKARLEQEGLFAADIKQPLPVMPASIGVVTSPSGAAVRDILHVLKRRFPAVPVTIYPTAVQGDPAKNEIAAALKLADEHSDVIILARGGGSLEDLWAFNEEVVARAILACRKPVIAGVGHETDFTIADLVADVRAPTPSGAAEIAVPDQREWLRQAEQSASRLKRALAALLGKVQDRTAILLHRLNAHHPGAQLQQRAQLLDELSRRLQSGITEQLNEFRWQHSELRSRLQSQNPASGLQLHQEALKNHSLRLRQSMRKQLDALGHAFGMQAARLNAVSPLATLDRGYAMVSDSESGDLISSVTQVGEQQVISTRLSDGEISSIITAVKKTSA